MLADIGLIALAIAFLFCVYATFISLYGALSGRVVCVVVVYALYTFDFSLAYVNDVSSRAMSPFLRVTALWGGQNGSVLFWAWLMASFVGLVLLRKWERDRELMPYVIFVAMLTTTFSLQIHSCASGTFQARRN
jgi:cytochrome c-type biogenesis protein CcmF